MTESLHTQSLPIRSAHIDLPSAADVRDALERILSSTEFHASPHLAAFLRYSVEETLAGDGANIKAYSIATCALGRPASFDPQADPIIRVEATRLRRAMERYYRHEGADDPVLIDIPRGRYMAYFSFRDSTSSIPTAARPVLVESSLQMMKSHRGLADYASKFRQYWGQLSTTERSSIAVFVLAMISAVFTWSIPSQLGRSAKPTEQALVLQTSAASETGTNFVTGSTKISENALARIGFATLQLAVYDGDHSSENQIELIRRLNHLIAEHKTEFDGINMVEPSRVDRPSPVAAPFTDETVYSLMATVFRDEIDTRHMQLGLRLIHRPSDEIIWAKSYHVGANPSAEDHDLITIRDELIVTFAGLKGAIRVDAAHRNFELGAGNTALFSVCLAESDIALRTRDAAMVEHAHICLANLIAQHPTSALLFKQAAALHVEMEGRAPDRKAAIRQAIADLDIALKLEPQDEDCRSTRSRLQSMID